MSLLEKILVGISKEIGEELSPPMNTKSLARRSSSSEPRESSQIIQVSQHPLSLNLAEYHNAYSNANPEGDPIAAQKFQQLVDSIPELNHESITSPSSIEKEYGRIVNGASCQVDNSYLNNIISSARYNFKTSAQAEFVAHGEWRIVEAIPNDWYSANKERFKKMKIPLNTDNDKRSGLTFLGDKASLTTLTLGEEEVSLSKATHFTHCELEYMLVRFVRPWMDFSMFQTDGWWLSGQEKGYCSSGRTDANKGILPLITTGMILAHSAQFEGNWDPKDQKKISDSHKANEDVYIGPYMLSDNKDSVSTVTVVAWISELVPFSPKLDGSTVVNIFRFRNEGQFKTICVVKWKLNGEPMKTRCLLKSGNTDKIEIPRKAIEIVVVIRARKGTEKKQAFRKKYATLSNNNYVIKGTFEDLRVEEE